MERHKQKNISKARAETIAAPVKKAKQDIGNTTNSIYCPQEWWCVSNKAGITHYIAYYRPGAVLQLNRNKTTQICIGNRLLLATILIKKITCTMNFPTITISIDSGLSHELLCVLCVTWRI